MPRGRPKVTEEVLRQRIADYCARYGVTEMNDSGFPVFPSGRRETPQHREWIVLFKARSRLQRATAGGPPDLDRDALVRRQDGRCPVCGEPIDGAADRYDERGPSGPALLHAACLELARRVEPLGAGALERLRAYLWPARR
jgi:hypothetical protein